MREIWVLPNRRALWFSMLLPAFIIVGSTATILLTLDQGWSWIRFLSLLIGGCAVIAVLLLLRAVFTPRLAYEAGHLLVFLRSGSPIRVPIEFVEVFFLGQAAAKVADDERKSSAIVVRLAERAKEWRQVTVRPALGEWCDGYITIRGTWCEPVRPELLEHLQQEAVPAAHPESADDDRDSRHEQSQPQRE